VPAAAVIPASRVYTKAVAVKKLVVEFGGLGSGEPVCFPGRGRGGGGVRAPPFPGSNAREGRVRFPLFFRIRPGSRWRAASHAVKARGRPVERVRLFPCGGDPAMGAQRAGGDWLQNRQPGLLRPGLSPTVSVKKGEPVGQREKPERAPEGHRAYYFE